MKAIVINSPGDVYQLKIMELPMPVIKENEVLVQVKAISINPVDVKTRSGTGVYGRIKDEQPLILGWDISGVIIEMGSQVTTFKKGDEVFGMVNFPGHGKAYAEYVAVPADQLAVKPHNISHEEAAAATLAALTAWQALVTNANLKSTDKALIHAAAGGVGHFAVQIAKHIGAYVIGTASAANKDFLLSLGVDEPIDYQVQPFEEVMSGVDFVLDTVGGNYLERSLDVAKKGGTAISILGGSNVAVAEKAKEKGVNCYSILVKSSGSDMQHLADLLEKGAIKAHIAQTYPFAQMAVAHTHVETGRTVGKVVVTV